MQPYIGALRLSDIRASDLAAAYRGLERGTKQHPSPKRPRQGLATSTVARYANWVNTIFLAALDEGLIVKNPADSRHAGRPKGETAKRVKPFSIWNVEQLTGFCDWATAEDEPWAVAWVLLARTGLRSGELLALRWGDLDFAKREMRLERALHYDETRPRGERYVLGPPKGGRSRTVTFDQTCVPSCRTGARYYPRYSPAMHGTSLPCSAFVPPTRCSRRCPAAPQPSPDCTPRSCECRALPRAHPDRDLPRSPCTSSATPTPRCSSRPVSRSRSSRSVSGMQARRSRSTPTPTCSTTHSHVPPRPSTTCSAGAPTQRTTTRSR